MDEELTDGYKEPCVQCGAVAWALSDGLQFFCKNCHNVIERTQEIVDVSTYLLNNRISTLSRSYKKTEREGGQQWMVCEGFQIILKRQAEALVGLGVCPQFKTNVLWDFWKLYLQKTRQAYTRAPVSSTRNPVDLSSESEPESAFLSEASDLSGPTSASVYSSDGKSSVCSGSLDAAYYFDGKERRSRHLMSMPRTLALCHLALLWLREAITLTDLLRLVSKRLVPYVNVHEHFPEEIRFFGRDAVIFRAETIPSYTKVHMESLHLAKILQLSAFPPVSQNCLLHPGLLSLRYLMDANLPYRLHSLVCQVIEKTAMDKDCFLTFDPSASKSILQCYDLQAAAVIIVTLKLLFKLDDQVEWSFSRKAKEKTQESDQDKKEESKQGSKMFSLRRWYMIVQPALEQAREREELVEAKQQWKAKKPVIASVKHKTVVLKRRRVVEQLQSNFCTLAGSDPEQQPSSPFTFHFLWGKEEDADGPSLHNKDLSGMLVKEGREKLLVNKTYWHTDFRHCHKQNCWNHFPDLEPTLPRMYVWVLGLFSFLLGVSEAELHKEVVKVEQRLILGKTLSDKRTQKPQRKRKRAADPV
ncbi:TATA box-binding protein-associated factor RNA polymerase I subunit B [Pygocentrus nattereri]|uniref:TATA box-binding protein-associated factor RNA polymerase I subunit B n=1 Tax=Pygocentrus nattereri TaxID=42514 RepID=A0A3B4D2K2_PYGNA|nr:TATA box-binding protein-associated factor RNA polymerase I subunit B [Pygocentrus nattereri]